MGSCGCNSCETSCGCSCHSYTSPSARGQSAARLGRLMDRGRDALARAGLRPWIVRIVRVRWMGGRRRGDGPVEVVAAWEILPTPKVGDASGINELIMPDQIRETGSLLVSEISNSYTEDMLLGRGPDGSAIGVDESVFWEVAWIDGRGCAGEPARYTIDRKPTYIPATVEWQVTLVRAHNDRQRDGTPR